MLSKLNLYLTKKFLSSFVVVFLIFATLLIIGDFVEQFRKSTGKDVPISIVIQLSLYNFLNLITYILPIVAFFGSLVAFVLLVRNSELIIIGSVGISNLRLLIPALIINFLIGIIFITTINPLTAVFNDKYSELEYKYINKTDKFASITKNGLWLKQFNDEINISSVLYAKNVDNNGVSLKNFMLLEYDNNGAFQGRLDGEIANLKDGYWNMKNVQMSPKYGEAKLKKSLNYSTNINPEDITNSLSSPTSISFWKIRKFINFLEELGYSSRDFKLHYYGLLIMPIFMSALTALSASIISDLKQNDKLFKIIILSFFLVFVVYFFSNLFDALGSSAQISPLLSKIITPLITIFFTLTLFQISSFRRRRYIL